jgi:hypothetical protein
MVRIPQYCGIYQPLTSEETFFGINMPFTEQGGFGVPVANVLFAPSTLAFTLPGASCAGLFGQGLRLSHFQGTAPKNIIVLRTFPGVRRVTF